MHLLKNYGMMLALQFFKNHSNIITSALQVRGSGEPQSGTK